MGGRGKGDAIVYFCYLVETLLPPPPFSVSTAEEEIWLATTWENEGVATVQTRFLSLGLLSII